MGEFPHDQTYFPTDVAYKRSTVGSPSQPSVAEKITRNERTPRSRYVPVGRNLCVLRLLCASTFQ
jgi:hypothetical protein